MSRIGKKGEPYTAREADVAALLHLSNKGIAKALDVSEDTVRKHVSNVLRKAGVDRRSAVPDVRLAELLDAVDALIGFEPVNGGTELDPFMRRVFDAREAFR